VRRKARELARRSLPFLSPVHRRYVEWTYETSTRSRQRLFTNIYKSNFWGDSSSASGQGSNLEQTVALRVALPQLLETLGVRSLLDVPCGDLNWIRHVDLKLDRYVGGDIVGSLVDTLQREYGGSGREFVQVDVIKDRLPKVDAILCRDCLVHFSFRQIASAVRNFQRSGAEYLLATTFPERASNQDIVTGDWRTLNMCAPPLHWPEPLLLVNEGCTQSSSQFADKSLGVWKLAALPGLAELP
jgi:hypothetical protein